MHSKRVYWSSVLCVLLGACAGLDSQPEEEVASWSQEIIDNLVINGSFELRYEQTTGINGGWPGNAGWWAPIGYGGATDMIPGWTVSGGGVDWHDSSFGPQAVQPTADDGFRAVDLNSAVGQGAGAIFQRIATTPGAPYVLTFSYSAHPYGGCYFGPKPMRASAGNASLVVTPDPWSEGYLDGISIWHSATLTFTATSSSTMISFASLIGYTCAGPLVDDVVVEAVPPPAPLINVEATGCNSKQTSLDAQSRGALLRGEERPLGTERVAVDDLRDRAGGRAH